MDEYVELLSGPVLSYLRFTAVGSQQTQHEVLKFVPAVLSLGETVKLCKFLAELS